MKLKQFSDLQQALPDSSPPAPSNITGSHDGRGAVVRIFLETKGRKGKSVTVVSGMHHNPAMKHELAKMLKEHCGAGGTVKENTIEIQGDQRVRGRAFLEKLNYVVKGA